MMRVMLCVCQLQTQSPTDFDLSRDPPSGLVRFSATGAVPSGVEPSRTCGWRGSEGRQRLECPDVVPRPSNSCETFYLSLSCRC